LLLIAWFCNFQPNKKKQRKKQQRKRAADSTNPVRSIRLASLKIPSMADMDSDDMHSPGPGHDFLCEDGYEGTTDNDSYEEIGAKIQ
jgi:hypothetical protein